MLAPVPAVGRRLVPGVLRECIPGLVTAMFLPLSVAVLVLGLVLVARHSKFDAAASEPESSLGRISPSLSSGSDRSLPTIDSGVNAYSDKDRNADGDENVAETEVGDAVDAPSPRLSLSPWATAL